MASLYHIKYNLKTLTYSITGPYKGTAGIEVTAMFNNHIETTVAADSKEKAIEKAEKYIIHHGKSLNLDIMPYAMCPPKESLSGPKERQIIIFKNKG